jgi:hypothetical protein
MSISYQESHILNWLVGRLESVKGEETILIRDPYHLLAERENALHAWASEHEYTVVVAATNLAFRYLYQQVLADPEVRHLLVIDRTPQSRLRNSFPTQAPPIFYPDLLERTALHARITLDLQKILIELTADSSWPQLANTAPYPQLIKDHLPAVLEAHKNLRSVHHARFSDTDFQTIVTYAALGIEHAAFKTLTTADYWRISLLGPRALRDLEHLTSNITKPLKEKLKAAPAPFCWFERSDDPEIVLRAFYLSMILAQHHSEWRLLLAQADKDLAHLNTIPDPQLREAAGELLKLTARRVQSDLQEIEEQLSRAALQRLLIDALRITDIAQAASLIEHEHYSTLFRTLALLLALDNLLSSSPDEDIRKRIETVLDSRGTRFVDRRESVPWDELKTAYQMAGLIQDARKELGRKLKDVKAILRHTPNSLTFATFRDIWNTASINKLEYYLSALKRLIHTANLLERQPADLPAVFNEALERMKDRVDILEREVFAQLKDLNLLFQRLVERCYPEWLSSDKNDVYLSSQFIRRCLKPYWDPQHENAVVLLFDGMRYDIWDELLRPALLESMELVRELPAASILPSETHVSRWAIAAGKEPESFGAKRRPAENMLLQQALKRDLRYDIPVDVVAPQGAGTGETVRYRAGNLLYYIFEFCDKELHKITMKELPDGRKEPSRPLAFIYRQYVQNFIDTEVMAIVRQLRPSTKVFIVADHGFGFVGQDWLGIDPDDLNEPGDCTYSHTILKVPFVQAALHPTVRNNSIAFTTEQLHYPREEKISRRDGTESIHRYRSILFPRMGYSFSRKASPFRPDAYGHGGISLQELVIPMAVLQVKPKLDDFLTLTAIEGPSEVLEGEEAEFSLRLLRGKPNKKSTQEIRVDIEASYSSPEGEALVLLPQQIHYVAQQQVEIRYRFSPDVSKATEEEHRQGFMRRELTLVARYRDGERSTRKAQTHSFVVRLNAERIVRHVPPALGSILGLTPKGLR